jgi:hypothetical protein
MPGPPACPPVRRTRSREGGNRGQALAPTIGRAPTSAGYVRSQLLLLREAVRAGNALDALAAAARIHAITVRPNMRPGRWPQAVAGCECVLSHIPARQAPGYLPKLSGVLECLHADAALAARNGGDFPRAELHLTALIGYLHDRQAPVARQAVALIDLAHVYIAAGKSYAGGRILAGIGPFLTGGFPWDPAWTGTAPVTGPPTMHARGSHRVALTDRPELRAGQHVKSGRFEAET